MALWYAIRAFGLVSMVLLTTVMVLGLLTAGRRTRSAYVTTGLHRSLSLLAVTFVGLHVATSVIDSYVPIRLTAALVPFTSTYRPLWVGLGAVALDLLIALISTSLLRSRLGHRTWRALHWTAYATWPIALTHAIGTGTDDRTVLALTAACVLAVVAAATGRLAPASKSRPPTTAAPLNSALSPSGRVATPPPGARTPAAPTPSVPPGHRADAYVLSPEARP